MGGRHSGKGLHVDQVFWSNVGHNVSGYKLLATWPAGRASTKLHETMLDSVFAPPLTRDQLAALRGAARVVLLRPGDVFVMSGGVAHATLTVGSEELNMTAYESFVSLNPRHARHFLRTGDKRGAYSLHRGAMPRRELEDFKDHTIDALEALVEAPRPAVETARFAVPEDDAVALRAVLRAHAAATAEMLCDNDSYYRKYLRPRTREGLLQLPWHSCREALERRRAPRASGGGEKPGAARLPRYAPGR